MSYGLCWVFGCLLPLMATAVRPPLPPLSGMPPARLLSPTGFWMCKQHFFQVVTRVRAPPSWTCAPLPPSVLSLLGPCHTCALATTSWNMVGGKPTETALDCLLLRGRSFLDNYVPMAARSFHICLLYPRAMREETLV